MSCYNNGPWESNNNNEEANMYCNQSCEPYSRPSYLVTQIVPPNFNSELSGTGCLPVTLHPSNIKVTYVTSGKIDSNNKSYTATGTFVTLDPLSYSSHECNMLSSISVSFDFSSVTPQPFTTNTITVDLPVDMTESTTRLQKPPLLTEDDPSSCPPPTTEADLLINYYYTGYCNNITVTITNYRIRNVPVMFPLYKNPNL